MRSLLAILCVALGVIVALGRSGPLGLVMSDPLAGLPPGLQMASSAPRQTAIDPETVDLSEGATASLFARFEIEALVLAQSHYRWDEEARYSPVDLALGWGPMSDGAILSRLSITQSGRLYFYRWQGHPPIPRQAIVEHSANMHMVPLNDTADGHLKSLRPGQVVRLTGYLGDISAPDGRAWRSSRTRRDTGHGACELVFVEDVRVIPRPG